MKQAVLYGPGDVRVEERAGPTIIQPTDAIIRLAATCICGSDLWPYRGIEPITGPTPTGHEYCGVVEQVGSEVKNIKVGDFVVGSLLTGGLGAHSTVEAVGTQESIMQAIRSTRPGGHVGYVGVFHDVQLPGDELFFSGVHVHGGPAPVRRFLPTLMQLICDRKIDPGKVFDLELPLEQAAEGYRAMDERRAIKALLCP
jgi:threonine dehydrogenase-like Zn-dependent dehydrogenase